jgi:hypothetical protein
MNRLALRHRALWAGQFTLTTERRTYSLGESVEVALINRPYDSGERCPMPRRGNLVVISFPLVVIVGEHINHAEWRLPMGVAQGFLADHLVLDKHHKVKSRKYEYRGHVWYYPEIDGKYPGMNEAAMYMPRSV